ncbi:hypothetical protein A6M21_10560 [Desulfotomaculum copahuensis]|uniref:NodB homology domain-containing protein n=2 Tax=Desulfotomaculum copahuensis TaxID=1838280 RepID=A0A1B7LEW6_9FIRM|nr:hypothetical protein A6M21_10560 [Desulfotomaculum copahuensis]
MFKLLTFLLGLYALLPTALARLCHVGVVWRVPKGGGRVAITFDDGPDPVYTPQVLKILKQYNVRACFFVLGERALAFPELVAQIHTKGHEVACHGYKHRIPWLLGPRATARDVREANAVLTRITGQQPRLYRPPWGMFNIFSLLYRWIDGQRVVLWSFMSWDWGRRATPRTIARQVLSRVADGSILVFHDSDGTPGAASGAPVKMLAALPLVLSELQKRGLKITSLAEMTAGRNHFSCSLQERAQNWWMRFDNFIIRHLSIENVDLDGKPSLFRLARRRYRGKPLTLPDGVVLRAGDPVGELHLNNNLLREITARGRTPERIALLTLKELRRSLPALAGYVRQTPRYRDIKALLGLTMLHQGTERLGFIKIELPSGLRRIARWYQGWLLVLMHPEGRRRLTGRKDKLTPKLVVISRAELLRRYLPAGNGSAAENNKQKQDDGGQQGKGEQ